jgi:hypothetical protein
MDKTFANNGSRRHRKQEHAEPQNIGAPDGNMSAYNRANFILLT